MKRNSIENFSRNSDDIINERAGQSSTPFIPRASGDTSCLGRPSRKKEFLQSRVSAASTAQRKGEWEKREKRSALNSQSGVTPRENRTEERASTSVARSDEGSKYSAFLSRFARLAENIVNSQTFQSNAHDDRGCLSLSIISLSARRKHAARCTEAETRE